ncbi:DNA helicase RecQ [Saccharicrinis aurantiacus]|uniref:DNA helicase RecQ n=1 Tax=Saccharicrinis aurantiacus TaxID=1849719 RepID=UPI00094F9930|nr:DNA helicase RecQ [Saccharicrinis aurantiacus]
MGKKIDLSAHLKRYFGFDTFKGNQEEVIENVLKGNDTFVLMPTGGGKSLCYQLPSLILSGTAIIISPLIALMKNQVDAIRNISGDDSVAHYLNSSLTKTAITKVKEDIVDGKTKLLYVAPESLTKEENIEFLKSVEISFYAVDEAHCISEWGHDFRPEYRRIRPIIEEIGTKPLMALTATATPKVQSDIQKSLGMVKSMVFKSSFNRPNLYYDVRAKKDATKQIIKILKENVGKSGIIYCLSRKKVEELAEVLQVNGIKARPYHAGMDAATRAGNQDAFLMEDCDVIVATIAFGMGIDKPDVRLVMHYDIPKSLEGYYQETGRAGRDGGEGRCITFYSYKDIQKLEKFMQGKPIAEQEIGKQLLLETVSYAESSICRRKILLHYFGEKHDEDCCDTCDNCVHPKEQHEGQDNVALMIKTILELKERFKADYISPFLAGKSNSVIKTYKHDEHELFGAGKEKDEKYWNAVIRQLLVPGLLVKEIENYGILKVSDLGKEFLAKPRSFFITQEHDFESVDIEEKSGGGTASVDPQLLSMLKDLRKKISKRKNLPPFVIFQDPSLEAMAIHYPISLEELNNIPGVGSGKAKRFGKEFVDLIKKHVDDNEIERPVDLVVKSVANKSKNKISIIQSIDRQINLTDIASSQGIDMEEFITELESIVYSGTRVNIDYYIDQVMDEDTKDDIFDYFKEDAESDDIGSALEELGEEYYSEENVRLVRIKFLSEVGN